MTEEDDTSSVPEWLGMLADLRVIVTGVVAFLVGAAAVMTWLVAVTNTPSTADRALRTAQQNRQVLTDLGYSFRVVLCTSDNGQGLTERGRELLQCDELGNGRRLSPNSFSVDSLSYRIDHDSSPMDMLANRLGASVALHYAMGKARAGPSS